MAKQSKVDKGPDRPASDKGRSRLGDTTRPIAIDRRLTTNRRWAFALGLLALVVAAALAVTLFVTPIRNYLDQDERLATRADQLKQLEAVNSDLEAEVERLQSDAGVREAAKEEIGYQNEGEERETIIDPGKVPTALPAGWPYSLVTNIVATRTATAPVTVAPPGTAPPGSTAPTGTAAP